MSKPTSANSTATPIPTTSFLLVLHFALHIGAGERAGATSMSQCSGLYHCPDCLVVSPLAILPDLVCSLLTRASTIDRCLLMARTMIPLPFAPPIILRCPYVPGDATDTLPPFHCCHPGFPLSQKLPMCYCSPPALTHSPIPSPNSVRSSLHSGCQTVAGVAASC